jgi:hypothetical protein
MCGGRCYASGHDRQALAMIATRVAASARRLAIVAGAQTADFSHLFAFGRKKIAIF